MLEHDRERGVGIERQAAGQGEEGGAAEIVDIGAEIDIDAIALLGAHEGWGADPDPDIGDIALRPVPLGQAEIGDLADAFRREHEIVRLDVAMDHALLGRHLQAERRLPHDVEHLHLAHAELLMQDLAEVLALDEFDDHEVDAQLRLFAEIVNVQDVRVVDLGQALGFAFEARDEVAVARQFRRQHLDCDAAIQAQLAGVVDRSHATLADLAVDEAAAQRSADERIIAGLARSSRNHMPLGDVERRMALRADLLIVLELGAQEAVAAYRAGDLPADQLLGRRRGGEIGNGVLPGALLLRITFHAIEEIRVKGVA